jgi:hypothetical protein
MFKNTGTYFFFGLALLGLGFAFFRILYLMRKLRREREAARPKVPGKTP